MPIALHVLWDLSTLSQSAGRDPKAQPTIALTVGAIAALGLLAAIRRPVRSAVRQPAPAPA